MLTVNRAVILHEIGAMQDLGVADKVVLMELFQEDELDQWKRIEINETGVQPVLYFCNGVMLLHVVIMVAAKADGSGESKLVVVSGEL